MAEHGGRLRQAARDYGIPLADWLDLSTGIAPYSPPLPAIAPDAWRRLPEPDDDLADAARSHYGNAHLLPVAGSQAAIQALPRLRPASRVGVFAPAYAEHAEAWQAAGHTLVGLNDEPTAETMDQLDVLIVINPNNPTGRLWPAERLLDWHTRLAARGGWLIVDEAFIDCAAEHSLVARAGRPGLIVLRSFGKFFGLAGARLGFAFAEPALLAGLDALLGPWAVSGPTRALASAVLRDHAGQQRQRERLLVDGQRLARLLTEHGLPPAGGCALFNWRPDPNAAELHDFLARRGILTRLFLLPVSLRLGLPSDQAGWARLDQALTEWSRR